MANALTGGAKDDRPACEDRTVEREHVTVELAGPVPLDLHRTLAPLGHGPFDPAYG